LSRLALAVWMAERVSLANGWSSILVQGVRIDIATVSFLLFVPVLLSVFATDKHGYYNRFTGRLLQIWFTLSTVLLVFIELATPSFIQEYNLRPNRLFIEYLVYPKEVFGMLFKSRLLELIGSTILTSIAGFITWRWLGKRLACHHAINWKIRPLAAVVILLAATLGVRSSFGHRPLNPAMVYFSNDPLVTKVFPMKPTPLKFCRPILNKRRALKGSQKI